MKYKKIAWRDSTFLNAGLLNLNENLMSSWSQNLLSFSFPYFFGVIDYQIENSDLSSGLINLKKIEAILQDGTYENYKGGSLHYTIDGKCDYSRGERSKITLDLKNIIMENNEQIIYLCKSPDCEIISEERLDEAGSITEVEYEVPKLFLSSKPQYISYKIFKVNSLKGEYQINFCGPRLNLRDCGNIIHNSKEKLLESIEELYLCAESTIKTIKNLPKEEKPIENLIFLESSCYIASKLQIILKNKYIHPFQTYGILCDCLSKISWRIDSNFIFPPYDHFNSENVLLKLVEIILSVMNRRFDSYKLESFQRLDRHFIAQLQSSKEVLLSVSPNNEEIRSLILNSQICSSTFSSRVLTERIIGAKREIINSLTNSFVVRVYTNEFIDNSALNVYINYPVDNLRITLYYK